MYKEIPEMTPEKTGESAIYLRGEHPDDDYEITVTTYDDGTCHDGSNWWASVEECEHYHSKYNTRHRAKTYEQLLPDGRLVRSCWTKPRGK